MKMQFNEKEVIRGNLDKSGSPNQFLLSTSKFRLDFDGFKCCSFKLFIFFFEKIKLPLFTETI